jgi:hypothetical protein
MPGAKIEVGVSYSGAGGKSGDGSFEQTRPGMDSHFGELSLIRCRRCIELWPHDYYVSRSFAKSGHWDRGLILRGEEGTVTLDCAWAVLDKLDRSWCGGSGHDRRVVKRKGPLNLFP